MEKQDKIYVAGHRGMVGSAIVRELKRQGYENIITRTHAELLHISCQIVMKQILFMRIDRRCRL